MPKIELINADCMEYLKGCEDNAFELSICDPPYGINAASMSMGNNPNRKDGWSREESTAVKSRKGRLNQGSGKLKNRALNTMACEWDFKPPNEEYFKELMRVSKNQIIWGVNFYPVDGLTGGRIVWDKLGTAFGRAEMAYYSGSKSVQIYQFEWNGMIQGDMKNKEHRIHPTQKPVKLYEWLLKNYAKEGDRILDTHLGSGSSAIAAHYGGFDFVGIELDEDYYKAACERFDMQTRQQALAL